MRVASFTLIFAFMTTGVSFAQKPLMSHAKLESVKVYRALAELQSSVVFTVPSGRFELVVGNVAEAIDENSVQIAVAEGTMRVQSVQFTGDYYKTFGEPESHGQLSGYVERVRSAEEVLAKLQIELEAQRKSLELLDGNQRLLVGQSSASVDELAKLRAFYTKERIAIGEAIRVLEARVKEQEARVQESKSNLQAEESKIQGDVAKGALIIKGFSSKGGAVRLSISYLALNAGWSPLFEVEGLDINSPLAFHARAVVRQHTGMNWQGVKLSFVNATPFRHNVAPELSPWFLYAKQPSPPRAMRSMAMKSAPMREAMGAGVAAEEEEMFYSIEEERDFIVESNQLNVSYEVGSLWDIRSNNEEHQIDLYRQEVPAEYIYFTAPNYQPEAYLIAEISDFHQYNLISAPATIVFERMYVGKTYLDAESTEDKLKVTLGYDRGISVRRENVDDKSDRRIFSGGQERLVTYDLVIRNNKREEVRILVADRYPLSTDERVKIELLESSAANVEKEKGFLRWDLKLAPSESRKLRVSFKVRYPRGMRLENF